MANIKIKPVPLDDEIGRILHEQMMDKFQTSFVLVGEETCFPVHYRKFAEAIEIFEVRDDDIWVCSFPKTGTTWAQEMVWMISNNLDFERPKVDIQMLFPFFEVCTPFSQEAMEEVTAVYGSFWKHVLGYWEHGNDPNMIFLKYEDMKKNLPAVLREVSYFLGKLLSDEQTDQLAVHLSFESM